MALRLLYYHPSVLTDAGHAGREDIRKLSFFSNLADPVRSGHMLIDRSGTIRTPVRSASIFPIPQFRRSKKTYEDICDERAQELLRRADSLKVPLYTFWSGGIDSTLVLVSLLKNATLDQKKNIVVHLTENSIAENPRFWSEHIHRRLRVDSSAQLAYLLGGTALVTNGDQNDQLFGVGGIRRFILMFGGEALHKPYKRETLRPYFERVARYGEFTDFYLDLFERVMQRAPVPIRTHLEYLWWSNFALKWQSTFMRTLSAVAPRNAEKITPAYLKERYAPFYCTDEFQLWSMNNTDKRIKNEWNTYKWPAKDIIYDYTGDKEYRDNKTKSASLPNIMLLQKRFYFLDDVMRFHHEVAPDEYYDPGSDFATTR